jgi:hypothetical protein
MKSTGRWYEDLRSSLQATSAELGIDYLTSTWCRLVNFWCKACAISRWIELDLTICSDSNPQFAHTERLVSPASSIHPKIPDTGTCMAATLAVAECHRTLVHSPSCLQSSDNSGIIIFETIELCL